MKTNFIILYEKISNNPLNNKEINLDDLVKSQKHSLSLHGRGLG